MSFWKRIKAWVDGEIEAINAETWAPNSMEDPRCHAVFLRQRQARQNMKHRGIRSLLDGRPAWAKVNPMGEDAPRAKVVRMRGKR